MLLVGQNSVVPQLTSPIAKGGEESQLWKPTRGPSTLPDSDRAVCMPSLLILPAPTSWTYETGHVLKLPSVPREEVQAGPW